MYEKFLNSPIRTKMLISSLSITIITILIFAIAIILLKYKMEKEHIKHTVSSYSSIINQNISAPLLFNDYKSAKFIIQALKSENTIDYVALFNKKGKRFVFYQREDYKLIPFYEKSLKNGIIQWNNDYAVYKTDIIFDNKYIGYMLITYSLKSFYNHLWVLIGFAFGGILIASLIASVLFTKTNKFITEPLLELTKEMKRVSNDKDFSKSINVKSRDEIGILSYGFNNMLYKIREELEFRKETEEKFRKLAHMDSLTKIPNRNHFNLYIESVLHRSERENKNFAILFIDLDGFKQVNDTYGHEGGDTLLKEISKRLKKSVRKSDFVARLGGDEFTIILENIQKEQDISKIAKHIIRAVAQPVNLKNGQKTFVSCSIGIAIYPKNGTTVDALISKSDTAMYHAKENGKNNFHFFDSIPLLS